MELRRAAAALCLCCLWSACRLRHGQLDAAAAAAAAAVVRSLPAAGGGDGGGGEEDDDDDRGGGGGGGGGGVPKHAFRNGTVVPHDYMVALYHRLAGGKTLPRTAAAAAGEPGHRADTVTGFVDQAQPRDAAPPEGGRRYLFDLSSLPELDEVVGAELRILRRPPDNRSSAASREGLLHRLLLYACDGRDGGGGGGGEGAPEPELIDSRAGDLLDAGAAASPSSPARWEVFDVGSAVRRRRRRRAGRIGPVCFLLQVVSEPSGKLLAPGLLGYGREEASPPPPPHERALLVVFSRAKRKGSLFKEIREKTHLEPSDSAQEPLLAKARAGGGGRRRRRTTLAGRGSSGSPGSSSSSSPPPGGRSHGKKARSRCSRKALHVNFKELGWDDWIIAPLDYEAYHCDGVCDFPLRSHLEPTNHAIIQTLMNSMDPEATPPSCCVPSKLSAISILYIDAGNNVVYKQYEDMVVEACGCR